MAVVAGALVATPTSAATTTTDVAVVGNVVAGTSIASWTGYRRLVAGPDVGSSALSVDPQAGTVSITVSDSGRRSTWTMTWPARVGS